MLLVFTLILLDFSLMQPLYEWLRQKIKVSLYLNNALELQRLVLVQVVSKCYKTLCLYT